jgi:hypothetical protein
MSRRFIGAGLLMAFILSLPWLTATPALAQKKKAADPAKADIIDSGKLAACELVGTLETTPGSDRMFNLECEQDNLVPTGKGNGKINPGGNPRPAKPPNMNRVNQAQQKIQQAMQHGQQAQARLASARNPQDAKKAQADLNKAQGELNKAQGDYQTAVIQVMVQANAQQNVMMVAAIRKYGIGVPTGYKITKVKSLVEFQASESVKVRTMVLPEEFDEKGKPKKYTKDELATLKGKDKNLPGYESSLDKLETGQKLRVVLAAVRKKPVAKAKEADKDPDKDVEDKDPKDKDMTEKKMQVKLILILSEAKALPSSANDKKK